MRPAHRPERQGTTTVEFAVACPIVFFVVLATIVGGQGVFLYQATATMAREGARWASVRGSQYAEETRQPAATAVTIYANAIVPGAVGLDLSKLSYTVTWDQNNMPLTVYEDVERPEGNTVTVTVNYRWDPAWRLIGPFNLTSTSTAQMLY
jgi:Flp pilus assembly protein TadG